MTMQHYKKHEEDEEIENNNNEGLNELNEFEIEMLGS